jgi:hypothetical protein
VLGECAPRCARRQRGIRHLAKSDKEGVALRVDLLSAVPIECGAENPAVIGQHLTVPVAQLFEQAGRALDIGEENAPLGLRTERTSARLA